jgi:predicted DCC family thiol-disulfide oxidoreductase YuxK
VRNESTSSERSLTAYSEPPLDVDAEANLYYDGDCPFCRSYLRYLDVQEAVGRLNLINIRDQDFQGRDQILLKFDLDEGMLLQLGDTCYHGSSCIHALARLSGRGTVFNRINAFVFRSARRAQWFYPILRAGRNGALRILGRGKISRSEALVHRQNLLLLVVPLIALTVFGRQLYHVAMFNLSPWRGGGMGMFSTIAGPQNRFIKAYFLVRGVRYPVAVPDLKEGLSFITEPTEANGERLKATMSQSLWTLAAIDESTQKPIIQSISPGALERSGRVALRPDVIHLELWQFSYEPSTRTVRTLKIWDDSQ